MASSWKTRLQSRSALIVTAVLGAGAVGAKMIWPEATPVKAVASAPKSALVKKPATRPGASPRTITAQRPPSATGAPQPAPPAEASEVSAAAIARPAYVPPAAKRAQRSEIDSSSDTEGLFLIASLRDGQNNDPPPTPPNAVAPAGDIASSALAERVVTTGSASGAVTDGLGAVYVDDTNAYFMRFPAGWSIRRFDGEPWVVEVSDGHGALISIGFSAFPSEYTADNIPLDWVARRIKKRTDTTLNAQGYATIMGRKAIWSKSTGPMLVNAKQIRMARTTYILPLGDGRVAEIRIAAAPENFDKLAGVMKNSVSTFRLTATRRAGGEGVAKTE
jgi:hypothetical protein